MTILTLLQDLLGPYKSFSTGEHYFTCPFCHNPKRKFAFNEHNLKWHCWHCAAKGGHVIWLLKRLDVSREQLSRFKEILSETDIKIYKSTTANSDLFLPIEYKPLWMVENNFNYLNALSYLQKRNVRAEDIMRYKIGYCETGEYKNRIIIPSYTSENKLNYFVARNFYNDGMKYKNPPTTKNIVCFENMISWNLPIVLCEGVFDAIALRRNAIPILGKTLPKQVELSLLKNNVKEVVIFLDADAREYAVNIEHKLRQYDIKVRTVTSTQKDPADMGFVDSWECVTSAKTTNLKDLIIERLSI